MSLRQARTWALRPQVDSAMLKARSRAFRWRKMLDEGVQAALEDLAQAKGVAPCYVSRVIRLTHGGGAGRAATGGCSWMFYWTGFHRRGRRNCAGFRRTVARHDDDHARLNASWRRVEQSPRSASLHPSSSSRSLPRLLACPHVRGRVAPAGVAPVMRQRPRL
jgi:hypothetical protein